jgi:hypothetical protein
MANSIAAKLAKEGVTVATVEIVKWIIIWLIPWGLAAITIVSGYFEHAPWVVTIPAATFVFAAATTGLLRYNEWRSRRSAADKLISPNITFGIDYVRDETSGRPIGIDKVQAVIHVQNLAAFPISYIVDEIQSSVWGHINPNPTYDTRSVVLGPISSGVFRDAVINMRSAEPKPVLDGTLSFKIRYGHQGREKYAIKKRVNLFAAMDHVSGTYPITTTQDAPQ